MSTPEREPLVLLTEKDGITLRQLTIDDALPYFESVDANRDHLSQFGDPTARNHQHIEDVEKSILEPKDPAKIRFGIWDDGVFTGTINLTPKEDESVEIVYWLDSRFTGKGYATLATKAVANYARGRYARVFAEVIEGNEASCRVLERAGLKESARSIGKIVFDLPLADSLESLFDDIVVDDIDHVQDFADDFLAKGLRGLALNSPEGIAQFKELYGQMWDRLSAKLLDHDAEWRSQGNPDEQIIYLFDAIWELRNDKTEGSIARTAFTLAFMGDRSDGKWGDIFGTTSYFGKNELLRVIESVCREGSFSAGYGPEHLATFLTNLVYVTYATWEMMPGQGLQDKNEWLDTIRGYLK